MKKWLIIYDIKNRNRLARIAKKLEGYGIRVQKSVFEAEMTDPVCNRLRSEVRKIMDDEDSIVYFDICLRDWQKKEKFGKYFDGSAEEDNYYIL